MVSGDILGPKPPTDAGFIRAGAWARGNIKGFRSISYDDDPIPKNDDASVISGIVFDLFGDFNFFQVAR